MCKRFVMSGEKKMVLKNVGACGCHKAENNNLTVQLWIVATLYSWLWFTNSHGWNPGWYGILVAVTAKEFQYRSRLWGILR